MEKEDLTPARPYAPAETVDPELLAERVLQSLTAKTGFGLQTLVEVDPDSVTRREQRILTAQKNYAAATQAIIETD